MPADAFTSELARALAPDVLERFLRYVRIDTQSQHDPPSFPSTAKQLDLSRLLAEELSALGLADARIDEHGYVFATLPATAPGPVPTIGLIAHLDTSPAVSGAGVSPQVVRYEGGNLPLPGDPRQVLSPAELPELVTHVGHDLVTSDGTTLLGADDKAGVAEIVTAVAYLVAHPEVAHGPLRIAFTTDEEIGEGTRFFDLEAFGAEVAYTVDGSTAGELQDETFSASEVKLTIRGAVTHTGTAKGLLVNGVKLAAALIARLPPDTLSPETTEGREGFVHPSRIEGTEEQTVVTFIVRDFDEAKLAEHETLLRRLADELLEAAPRAEVRFERKEQYRNMRQFLEREPRAIAAAELAVRRAGLNPVRTPLRGGTDGAKLSERGLPTPNLFTGGHEYHSVREWVCLQDMAAAVETLIHLVQVWVELASPSGQPRAATGSQ